MVERAKNTSFGQLFRTIRFRAGFSSLQELSDQFSTDSGVTIDPSLLSHWQRGARLPKDRAIILQLLQIFVHFNGITSPHEANKFCETAGMGYLTDEELKLLFPNNLKYRRHMVTDKKKTRIYFTASLAQKNELGLNYLKIISVIQNKGYQIQHDHITDHSLEDVASELPTEQANYYRQFLTWISAADIVVAEGSFPSTLNIGHEITVALNQGKIVVIFYKEGRDFFFLQGLRSENLFLVEYTEDNLEKTVGDILDFVQINVLKENLSEVNPI